MHKLFTEEEFNNAKLKDLLPLSCIHCGKTFLTKKKNITLVGKPGRAETCCFCSAKCSQEHNHPREKVFCSNCGKELSRTKSSIRSDNLFCNATCRAIFANKQRTGKPRKNSAPPHYCVVCGVSISKRRKYCDKHNPSITDYSKVTLKDCYDRYGSYQKSRPICLNARAVMKKSKTEMSCKICGYDKHVEVCHIKPITSFPLDTALSEINSISNLIYLCPNCHWELDHNLLKLE